MMYAKDPTLVFWDIKTYPVPSACDASRVAPCIVRFLKNSGYSGRVRIVAVGLLTDVPCDVLRAVSSTGIVLHHVSFGILSAMYHWIELNRPPKNVMLISSNPSFFAHIHANKRRDGYNIFGLFPYDSRDQESRWKNFLLEDSASLKEDKCSETFWVCSVCKEVCGQGFEKFTTHLNTPEHAQEATYVEEKAGAVTVFWDIKSLPVPPDCDPHRVGPCIKRFLKNEGFSGRITIAVIGLLTDVPFGILCALSSTTGIVLVNVISGSKDFVPYMYRCLSDSSPANLMFIRPGFSKNIIRDLQVSGHKVIQPFSDVRCIVERRWTKFLLEDSGTLEEDKCSETGEPVSWVCCKDICGQGFENFTMHLNSKEHVERWNRRSMHVDRSYEKDKEAVESATMATVFWDIKRFPVPPDCDPRLVGNDTLVFWDIKTYPVPSACDASRVAPCIVRFFKNSGYSGRVRIVAVGLLTDVPCDVLRAVSSTGIVLHHVSFGILSAMYHWIELNRPPKNMMLISSNPSFFKHIYANKHRDGYNIFELFPSDSCNQESRWKNFLLEDPASLKEAKCFETYWVCSVCKKVSGQGFEKFTTHLHTPEHKQEATYMEEKAGAVTVFWDIKSLPVPPDCDPHRVGPCIKRFLKNEGFSGRITIAVIGLLTDVPFGILCALSSTTGIVLVNVLCGSKDFVPYMYKCLRDSSPANLMFIRPEFFNNIIRDLQMSGHNVIEPFSDVRRVVEPRWKKFLLEDSGTLEEDKCSETGEPVSWVCCKDICGQGFENFTMHLNSKEHVERWNRRSMHVDRSYEKDKEAVEAGDEEINATMATVFWDIKRFPVPPDCDPRLVGPCIKRFLKDKGYSGHITIIVIGLLTDVPVDVLRALSSTTGIFLKNVACGGSKSFISVVYLWALDMMPCPANMMLIGLCPKGYSDFISALRKLGFSIIQPFPYRNVESLWKNFLLEDSGTLEEDKSSETGEPVSWVCSVCNDICGQGFEKFTMHLNSKEHVLEMLKLLVYRSNENDEEAVEAGDEAHLQTMMWDHMVGRTQRKGSYMRKRRRMMMMRKQRMAALRGVEAGFNT